MVTSTNQSPKLSLFDDIGRSLIRSGSSEAYIVAAEKFSDAGPCEVSDVLRAYEATMVHTAFVSVQMEYQVTQGCNSVLLEDGVTCYVLVDGVMVNIHAALVCDGKMRLLFTVVNVLKLHSTLHQLELTVQKLDKRLTKIESDRKNS
jgi:hypothetical protein